MPFIWLNYIAGDTVIHFSFAENAAQENFKISDKYNKDLRNVPIALFVKLSDNDQTPMY